MSDSQVRVHYLPRSIAAVFNDAYHWMMAVYHAVKLTLTMSRNDTAQTYRYCRHLDRTTFFRSQFKAYLHADPERVRRWTERRLFVDDMPDPAAFAGHPAGSVGRAYFEMSRQHRLDGLMELRDRRLEVLPEEKKGLDLDALGTITDPEELFERIVARRNIFMTSSHDFCHLVTGSSTDLPGEAVCAKYQYQHLLVPQNWMNMKLCMLGQLLGLHWSRLRQIRACFPAIESSANYSELDFDTIWDRPLSQVRRQMGLPAEGFMPAGAFPEALPERRQSAAA